MNKIVPLIIPVALAAAILFMMFGLNNPLF